MLLLALSLVGQRPDSSASIRGAAISSFNGQPLVGVMVAVPEFALITVTDSLGRFAIGGLPAGRRAIRISYDGRVTEDYVFELAGARTKRIAVLLDVGAIDLDPLVEEAREANIWRDLAGFYARRQQYRGFARFFTREEISGTRLTKLSSLLTVEGIVTRCSQECRPTRVTRNRICLVPVSVNGVAQREPDYDWIDISDVMGVEVYRGVPPADLSRALVPTASSSTWMGTGWAAGGSCGLVQIWTR
jgi:hypothetical protein